MNTTTHRKNLLLQSIFRTGTMLLLMCWGASVTLAASLTARVYYPSGTVLITSNGVQRQAQHGDILYQGNSIETGDRARVTLIFSDGHEVELSGFTKVSLGSLKLAWGRIVGWLSPWQQSPGSTFSAETPNAYTYIQFSQPHFELSYSQRTQTSVIKAYAGTTYVQKRSTGEMRNVPEGYSAIVRPSGGIHIMEIKENVLRRTQKPSQDVTIPIPIFDNTIPDTSGMIIPRATRNTEFTLTITPDLNENVHQK